MKRLQEVLVISIKTFQFVNYKLGICLLPSEWKKPHNCLVTILKSKVADVTNVFSCFWAFSPKLLKLKLAVKCQVDRIYLSEFRGKVCGSSVRIMGIAVLIIVKVFSSMVSKVGHMAEIWTKYEYKRVNFTEITTVTRADVLICHRAIWYEISMQNHV